MTISKPNMATNALSYLLALTPPVAIFKPKTYTKTHPKIWISSIPLTLTKSIHCIRPKTTAFLENSKAKPGRWLPGNC